LAQADAPAIRLCGRRGQFQGNACLTLKEVCTTYLSNAQIDQSMPAPPPQRNLIVRDIVERTGIDDAMIERLVRTFYARARLDPLIGPIFESKVQDWDDHIARLCAFWSSVALMSGRYHGQPMVAHLPLPIESPHFDRWLELFAETAREVCPPAAAAHFLERAHRIADSLEMGIAVQNGEMRPKRARPASTMGPKPAGR
jgi:hemoglobin